MQRKKDGIGTYTFASGNKFVGNFKDGKKKAQEFYIIQMEVLKKECGKMIVQLIKMNKTLKITQKTKKQISLNDYINQ